MLHHVNIQSGCAPGPRLNIEAVVVLLAATGLHRTQEDQGIDVFRPIANILDVLKMTQSRERQALAPQRTRQSVSDELRPGAQLLGSQKSWQGALQVLAAHRKIRTSSPDAGPDHEGIET